MCSIVLGTRRDRTRELLVPVPAVCTLPFPSRLPSRHRTTSSRSRHPAPRASTPRTSQLIEAKLRILLTLEAACFATVAARIACELLAKSCLHDATNVAVGAINVVLSAAAGHLRRNILGGPPFATHNRRISVSDGVGGASHPWNPHIVGDVSLPRL
jgi:hypothetical protein